MDTSSDTAKSSQSVDSTDDLRLREEKEQWEHLRLMSENIAQLRRENILCDVSLIIGRSESSSMSTTTSTCSSTMDRDADDRQNGVIRAHRCILAARCMYFRSLMQSRMKESDQVELHFPDKNYDDFHVLIEYFYTAKININHENAFEVLKLSDEFGVQSVRDRCVRYVMQNVSVENVFDVLEEAQSFCDELRDYCKAFIESYAQSLFQSEPFLAIQKNTLIELLKSDKIDLSELDIFFSVIEWGKHQLDIVDNGSESIGTTTNPSTETEAVTESTIKKEATKPAATPQRMVRRRHRSMLLNRKKHVVDCAEECETLGTPWMAGQQPPYLTSSSVQPINITTTTSKPSTNTKNDLLSRHNLAGEDDDLLTTLSISEQPTQGISDHDEENDNGETYISDHDGDGNDDDAEDDDDDSQEVQEMFSGRRSVVVSPRSVTQVPLRPSAHIHTVVDSISSIQVSQLKPGMTVNGAGVVAPRHLISASHPSKHTASVTHLHNRMKSVFTYKQDKSFSKRLKAYLEDVMPYIRFPTLSPSELYEFAEPSGMIPVELLLEAYRFHALPNQSDLLSSSPRVKVREGSVFYHSGVLENVPITIIRGWTLAYVAPYSDQTNEKIFARATGTRILLAARQKNSNVLALCAMGRKDRILKDTVENQTTLENGVHWYHWRAHSVGFSDTPVIQLGSADLSTGKLKLSWHLTGRGGYRCGDTKGLNESDSYEKLIFYS